MCLCTQSRVQLEAASSSQLGCWAAGGRARQLGQVGSSQCWPTWRDASFNVRSAFTWCHRSSLKAVGDCTVTSQGPFPTSKERLLLLGLEIKYENARVPSQEKRLVLSRSEKPTTCSWKEWAEDADRCQSGVGWGGVGVENKPVSWRKKGAFEADF